MTPFQEPAPPSTPNGGNSTTNANTTNNTNSTKMKHVSTFPSPPKACVDGNAATAHVAYRMNDCAYIFPITPSSPMGETCDEMATAGQLNLFGQTMKVVEMQSEAGAAGALHGALVSGSLATSFSSSQGLMLFIPNLYKIAGELLPMVIHVAARALAGEALSIYGDHSDTMMLRGCGMAMLSSFSVQEAHDMAVIAQMATLKSRVPFLHFMDGFRTSHEVNKIDMIFDDQLKELLPWDKMEEHRQRALSPMHPTQRGTAQSPDVFMQLVESSNSYYNAVDGIVTECMTEFEQVTGRQYHPFEYFYFGTTKPRIAIVTMGSSVKVVEATLRYLGSEQVCLVAVRMFRPWNPKLVCDALPESIRRIAVLDRTREGGSQGEPLYMDVCTSLMNNDRRNIFVAGGRYGLGSKDFTPRMVQSVISNMLRKDDNQIQKPFTLGITDDVTNLSLSMGRPLNTLDDDVTQCVFWGFGSDGTVGANKEAIKMIGNYREKTAVQAYFEYDAKKSSGWTISHLRFAPNKPIEAPWRIEEGQANYVACHNESYVQANKFDVTRHLKRRGTFFLNTSIASIDEPEKRLKALEALVSPKILRKLALWNAKFYIMDAALLATQFGLAGRINMICMSVFFRLSGVIPLEDSVALLKSAIKKNYSHKGEDVVNNNIALLDTVVSDPNTLILVDIPTRWRSVVDGAKAYENRHVALIDDNKVKKFMLDIGDPVTRLEGDAIPISKFLENNLLGGVMIPGTSKYEKRSPNPSGQIPEWEPNNCTQCNQCVFVCPHAAIRPFIVTKDEATNAPFPDKFDTLKAGGLEFAGKKYSLQISVLDCTGCNACVEACPEKGALKMGDIEDFKPYSEKNWEYAVELPERGNLINKESVRGSQFQTPLMEFSGACSGCGETPYFKLLTQLFGERMVVANATGCSTIWGGSFPSNPYTTNKKTGRGPAWANSLFEDNAEFGLGMYSAMTHRRERLVTAVQNYIHGFDLRDDSGKSSSEWTLVHLLHDWLDAKDEKSDKCTLLFDKMKPLFPEIIKKEGKTSALALIWSDRDMFPKLSQWICGGDGWAYDIGFGGLDHVEAFEANDVNVLVVDTEMYSNTGGQCSKATPAGASVAFARGGKVQKKKSIGEMFMTYEHVYVASVSLSDQAQTLQAFIEADKHKGPSIIIAYSPCVQQGVRPQGLNDMFEECKFAVESGYWPLYRYNPELILEDKNPFVLDSKKLRKDVTDFLKRESRFMTLKKKSPGVAEGLWKHMNNDVHHRMDHLNQLAVGYKAFGSNEEPPVNTLYASETGNAKRVATDFAAACTISGVANAVNDIDIEDLDGKTNVFFIATCGQGSFPSNGKLFLKNLEARVDRFKEGTHFMVFGLGDSSYYFFCESAKKVERRMEELGATKLLGLGVGDDSAAEGLDGGLNDWLDSVWPALELDPPKEVPHVTELKCVFSDRAVLSREEDTRAVSQYFTGDFVKATSATILSNKLMCRSDYNRDFRTIIIQKDSNLNYELGDALEIFPINDALKVADFLHNYSSDFGDHTVVKMESWGINEELSLGALFTHVLDLFGKPTKHFLHELATFETSEEERKTMMDPNFLKKESKANGITVADVLLWFKKAQPPLPALLNMIPRIKPRAYSIASSPNASKTTIELLVLIDTWWCDAEGGSMRYGLNCDMLRQIKDGDHLWCRIKAGSMEPPDVTQPVVCAGIGSGLAPHMAFLRDRVYAVEEEEATTGGKTQVASFSLYFGNRFRADEYLYQDELEGYQQKYNWFKLHTAFSRDNPDKKVYVQDLVGATDDARCLLLLPESNKGMLYVCGNRQLPKPLQEALVASFSQNSSDEKEIQDAAAAVEQLYIGGRAQQEVW